MGLLNNVKQLFKFGYSATESSPQRKAPSVILQSEDNELSLLKRQALVSTTRDLLRNYSAAKWAVNKHLDYVSHFTFQSRSGDAFFDQRFEQLMQWWSEPAQCDIAARHPLDRFTRLIEARAVVDGDCFLIKLASGQIQAIEGDRVRSPSAPETAQLNLPKDATVIDGVVVDGAGKMLGICVFNRNGNRFLFDRFIEAQYVIHHAYYDRFDQVRGISPLASGLNTYRDIMDASNYALIQSKITSLFGIKFTRKLGAEDLPSSTEADEKGDYSVDFGKGAFVLDMEAGDDAEFMQSSMPSTQFQAYMNMMLGIAMKSLDIPYSFYDEAYSTYSGSRQALLQYNQSAEIKRKNIARILDDITYWKLNTWVASGLLTLPANTTVNMINWEYVGAGLPWISPLQEINADILAINSGLTSRTRLCKERGEDFNDIADELAKEQALMQSLGISPSATPMPVTITQ
jgi:capsid protein